MGVMRRIWQAIDGFGNACYRGFRALRQPLTGPVCRVLVRLHINQSHVSLLRIAVLAGFLLLWLAGQYYAAISALAVYFFLDMVDGDLARLLKTESDLGKFEDSMGDGIMVVVLPLALIGQGLVTGLLGAYYVFMATLSWWLSAIRRNIGKGSDWLFHPEASGLLHFTRFWVMTILVILYVLAGIDIFGTAMLALATVFTLSAAYDYYQLTRERLAGRR